MASLFRQLSRTNSRTRKSKESHAKEELEEEMLQFSSCYIFGPCVGPQAATCLAKL